MLKIFYLARQPLDLRGQLADHPVRLRQPGRQLSGRQGRQLLSRGNIRQTGHKPQ